MMLARKNKSTKYRFASVSIETSGVTLVKRPKHFGFGAAKGRDLVRQHSLTSQWDVFERFFQVYVVE